jgi:predicted signal transduction protein with EAL and GGDEF domain
LPFILPKIKKSLQKDTSIEQALEIAELLREKAKTDSLPPYDVTASFGLASLRVGDDSHSLIELADRMLYQAKENGRDRVEADLQHAKRMEIETRYSNIRKKGILRTGKIPFFLHMFVISISVSNGTGRRSQRCLCVTTRTL